MSLSFTRFELPPSSVAKPLPTRDLPKDPRTRASLSKPGDAHGGNDQTRAKRKRSGKEDDDTPRAFKRLMGGYQPPRSGLDNGQTSKGINKKSTKTDKPPAEVSNAPTQPPTNASTKTVDLKPLPGESASAFSSRVNAALPIISARNRQSKNLTHGLKERDTKLEKKMKRMRAQWWEEDRRIKDKREENEEEMREKLEKLGGGVLLEDTVSSRKKRRRGRTDMDEECDIWAQVGKKNPDQGSENRPSANAAVAVSNGISNRSKGLVGLHDVVSAPPRFSNTLKAKLSASMPHRNVGHNEGGLKRQIELSQSPQADNRRV